MSDAPLTPEQWRARLKYTLRALARDASRYTDLTMTAAPPELNTPHIDYMLRPSFVRQLAEAISDLKTAVYQIEVQARFRKHRPEDGADLTIARQHLTEAAQSLTRISERARGNL